MALILAGYVAATEAGKRWFYRVESRRAERV
jgi:hypothetical protein